MEWDRKDHNSPPHIATDFMSDQTKQSRSITEVEAQKIIEYQFVAGVYPETGWWKFSGNRRFATPLGFA
jgi:hypothetical protein